MVKSPAYVPSARLSENRPNPTAMLALPGQSGHVFPAGGDNPHFMHWIGRARTGSEQFQADMSVAEAWGSKTSTTRIRATQSRALVVRIILESSARVVLLKMEPRSAQRTTRRGAELLA
jgi:hypothetical protein